MRSLRQLLALVVAATTLAGTAVDARAQLDPTMMSGLARPDGSIPAGTVTVRLLRGHDFDHPVGGHAASLLLFMPGGSIERRDMTSDPSSGRATFNDVPSAPGMEVRAATILDGRLLFSRSFEQSPMAGTATMLVGPAPGESPSSQPATATPPMPGMKVPPPEPSAQPIPAGSGGELGLVVRENGAPRAGVDVQLWQTRAGAAAEAAGHATSDAHGIAFFHGLRPGEIYVAVASYSGATFRSVPFTPDASHTLALGLEVRRITHDASNVAVGSEIIVGQGDDDLEVFESLELGDRGDESYESSDGGLLIPLPEGFHGADVGDESKALASVVDGQGILFKGRLDPISGGDRNIVTLTVGYFLPYNNAHHFVLTQKTPPGCAGLFGVVEARATDGLRLSASAAPPPGMPGPRLPEPKVSEIERPDHKGKELVLENLLAPPGGEISATIDGLATRDMTQRYVAGGIALLILLVGVGMAVRVPRREARERALAKEKVRLVDEILALERRAGSHALVGEPLARRHALADRLELVLRALDGDQVAASRVAGA